MAAVLCLTPAGAQAVRGDLTFAQCLKSSASTGCTAQPSLGGVQAVAVGVGGQSVYAGGGGTLAHFTRAADGSLAFSSCISNNGPATGCTDLPQNSLDVLDLAVSPDGARLYSAGQTLVSYTLGSGGAPTFLSCLYNDASFGCSDNGPVGWGTGLDVVAVSPDNGDVYAAGTDNRVSWFDPTETGLAFDGCIGGAIATDECADIAKGTLNGIEDLVITPDGSRVYGAARSTQDSVLHFSRAAGGDLTVVSCFANAGANGCSDPAVDALDGPSGLALHPDGGHLYAVARESNALFDFSLAAADGSLSVVGCLGSAGSASACPKTTGSAWASPNAAEISPDGDSLYVTSAVGSITHFPLAADGAPSGGQCVANSAFGGCVDLAADSLGNPVDIAASPDGKSVYVAAPGSNALTHFTRELSSTQPPPADSDNDGIPDGTDACPSVSGPASNNGCPISGGGGGGGGTADDPPDQAACENAEKKLEKAKKKLKKLKQNDAAKSAIRKAKEKVKKAKAAVAEACG